MKAQEPPLKNVHDRINRRIGQAIHDYRLIREGDRILVAISGGKDSLCMLWFLEEYRRKAPVRFELLAVNVDQGQPDFPTHILPELFTEWGIPYHIECQDTYSTVVEKTAPGKTMCSICSRLRRGILYRLALEHGCNKVALGHHRDDLLQTFLLNSFYAGKLGTMPPIYQTKDYELQVIRPLCSVPEKWLAEYAAGHKWPIIPCNLCGSQDGMRRQEMENLLKNLEKNSPRVRHSLFAALKNIHLNQLLDPTLWSDPELAFPHRDGPRPSGRK